MVLPLDDSILVNSFDIVIQEEKMVRNTVLLVIQSFLLVCNLSAYYNITVMHIDEVIEKVTEQTDCYAAPWNTNPINQCLACLVKEAKILEKSSTNQITILKNCYRTGFCTPNSILKIKNYYYIPHISDNDLLSLLTQKIFLTKGIRKLIIATEHLTKNGFLTENGIKKLLQFAQETGVLPQILLDSAHISNISKRVANLRQLFEISLTSPSNSIKNGNKYIIKEMNKGIDETYRLESLKQHPALDNLLLCDIPELPCLSLPIGYISYEDQREKTHYLAIIPHALGKSLNDYKHAYLQSPSLENQQLLATAFNKVGFTLGNFQKINNQGKTSHDNKTLAHGDFHDKNIYFDPATLRVTYIDNETVLDSVRSPVNSFKDILQLFYWPTLPEQKLKELFNIAFTAFIKGYISSDKQKMSPLLLKDIYRFFHSDPLMKNTWDEEYLQTAQPLILDTLQTIENNSR